MARKNSNLISLGVDDSLSVNARIRDNAKRHLAIKLRAYLLENGLRQTELARRAKLTRADVNSYLKERSFPSPANLRTLARTMGCDVSDLSPSATEAFAMPEGHAEMKVDLAAGQARVIIDQVVGEKTAYDIFALLKADRDAANRK